MAANAKKRPANEVVAKKAAKAARKVAAEKVAAKKFTAKKAASTVGPKKAAARKPATPLAPTNAGRRIVLERFVHATPDAAWALWTTPEGLGRWLASRATIDLCPGGDMQVVMQGCGTVAENRVLALKPGRKLELEWERTAARPTLLTVTFAPQGTGTRVTLVQSGFGDGPEADELYESFDAGWAQLMARFASAAERGGPREATLAQRVDAAPDEVWKALGSAEGLRRWFTSGPGTLDATRYDLPCGPTTIEGDVRAYEPGRTLAISWTKEPCTEQTLALPTVVTFHLTPLAKGGTYISLVHSGFGDGPEWDEIYKRHAATWQFLLRNLATVVDRNLDLRHRGRSIERSVAIAASPDRVWRALTDPAELARWECRKATLDAKEGGTFRFDWTGTDHADAIAADGVLHAEGHVLALEPARSLELSYHVPCFTAGKHPTLVSFELAPEGSGTRLTLVHSGFDADPAWDGYYRGHRESWDIDLAELVALCERGEPGTVLRCEAAFDGDVEAALAKLATVLPRATRDGTALVARGDTRVHALAERVGDETRIVVTESVAQDLDTRARYAEWRVRLESLGSGPVQCGSAFN